MKDADLCFMGDLFPYLNGHFKKKRRISLKVTFYVFFLFLLNIDGVDMRVVILCSSSDLFPAFLIGILFHEKLHLISNVH